jgi:cell division protein FtsI (penicillin-binding protein 3)
VPARLVERRIGLMFALFLVLLGAATLRAGYLFAFKGGSLKKLAATQQIEDLSVPAKRGTITDRHGIALAISADASTVFATPFQVQDPVATARKIAPLLGKPPEDVAAKLSDRTRGFVYLARKLKIWQGTKIERLRLPGIGVTDDVRRDYPDGPLASQLIGTVGIDNDALSGLELGLNGILRGTDGTERVVKDARGDPIGFDRARRQTAGHDVTLALDSSLQAHTEKVLADLGKTYSPKGATAIVTNPRNGEVLAMANWPPVDANDVAASPVWSRVNRGVEMTYEPGSTYKVVTVAGALEDRLVRPDTAFTLPAQIQVADRTIKEAHAGGNGVMTVSQILARSSNVGAVRIGLRMGKRRFDRWVRRFGFGELTGVPLPGESAGIVPHAKEYSGSSLGNLPIGQGLAVTPLQMAAAYGAVANGGTLIKPRLLLTHADRLPGRRVISHRTATRLQTMLEGVLGPGGTGSEAAISGYSIAGKTGTAQKAEAGGYSTSRFVASFVGFAPARHARLLVAVIVDEPKGSNYYGGEVAAPAFEKIASFALPYLGIGPR